MLSIQELIKKASEKKNAKKEILELFVKELDGNIKVEIPSPSELSEIIENSTEEERASKLVYECTIEPKLNDEVLIQTLKCKDEPFKVVEKITSAETIYQIAMQITNNSNKKMEDYRVEVLNNIKN